MCFDPWEMSIGDFAWLYLEAVRESNNPSRTEKHRLQWAGKAEFFELAYPDKLQTLSDEDLQERLDYIVSMYEGVERERLLEPAEAELKRRAKEYADVGSE